MEQVARTAALAVRVSSLTLTQENTHLQKNPDGGYQLDSVLPVRYA